jgi:hypothetical protein
MGGFAAGFLGQAAKGKDKDKDKNKTEKPKKQSKLGKVGGAIKKVAKTGLIASLKKGGHIKRTGLYRLHKGEDVVPARKGRGHTKRMRHAHISQKLASPPPAKKVQKKSRKRQYGKR